MLSDNIKNHRKKSNMSQDELAEKLGVSRQSVSLWETGQTQPTIDNIIALAKIFNISSDMLLGSSGSADATRDTPPVNPSPKKKRKTGWIAAFIIAGVVVIAAALLAVFLNGGNREPDDSHIDSSIDSAVQAANTTENGTANKTTDPKGSTTAAKASNSASANSTTKTPFKNTTVGKTSAPATAQVDIFSLCKDFAIKKGTLNGDYCIYQQPATKYGGYENEYFSISYWSDSDMVEFCLHCPLSETYSHNFYLRMRGGYDKKYEYLSSKYFRDTGESLRSATGYIDPAVFSDSYPISCDRYDGSADGQNQFMEDSRVGVCDLIHCLKEFVRTENLGCDFSAFEFVNF